MSSLRQLLRQQLVKIVLIPLPNQGVPNEKFHSETAQRFKLRYLNELPSFAQGNWGRRLVVVRHPFERMVSAFYNKLNYDHNSSFFYAIGEQIRRRFGATEERRSNAKSLTESGSRYKN